MQLPRESFDDGIKWEPATDEDTKVSEPNREDTAAIFIPESILDFTDGEML